MPFFSTITKIFCIFALKKPKLISAVMILHRFLLYIQMQNDTMWLMVFGTVLLLLLFVAALVFQWHDRKRTMEEMAHLASMHKHGVEHELVLKAMKLATWRLDVTSMTITYDSDFRARTDVLSPPPGCPFDTIMNAVNANDAERVRTGLLALCNGVSPEYHEQYRVKAPHVDREYWSESYATVAERNEEGKPLVIVGTSSCIDDAKRMEQDLVDARNKAEESDRLKTSFIDNISHEVRTPLNAIVGFSDILPTVTDPTERDGLISIIKENNQKLLNIFEDMMTISKAEASDDKTKMHITDFDAIAMLRGLVEEFDKKNVNPMLTLTLDDCESQLMLHSDCGRLREIVMHFLSNAFKFTDRGCISVKIVKNGDGHVRISVSDTGRGIPEEAYDRIFDRFVKLDDFVQGAGLGLSVCRSYAFSLGGTVGVRSRVSEGSTFWVDIPMIL